MLTNRTFPLEQWSNISSQFNGGDLILGNGASAAINDCYLYKSLLVAAKKTGLVNQDVLDVFQYLDDTKDFELVLNVLWHAFHVNKALQVSERTTIDAYESLRNALIKAVAGNHADYTTTQPYLKNAYKFMKDFGTIVSLSYDLTVYWAMLEGNSVSGGNLINWFKDGFTSAGKFDSNWPRLKQNLNAQGTTLVFYPHGNLAIAISLNKGTHKISRNNSQNLLKVIIASWKSGKSIPVFVSEGDSKQKINSIKRQDYPRAIYEEVLPQLVNKIVIYGWEISDNDDHILTKVFAKKAKEVAISVYTKKQAMSQDDIDKKCRILETKVLSVNKATQIVFFDAESRGCWIHP